MPRLGGNTVTTYTQWLLVVAEGQMTLCDSVWNTAWLAACTAHVQLYSHNWILTAAKHFNQQQPTNQPTSLAGADAQ